MAPAARSVLRDYCPRGQVFDVSLTPCRECAGQVAQEAARCPVCGVRRPGWGADERAKWLTVLLALVAAGVAISVVALLS